MLLSEIRKCILNRFFWGSVILIYVLYIFAYYKGLTYALDDTTHLFYTLYLNIEMSNAQWLKPLIAVIPFMFIYYEEWNSGEYYNVMSRSGIKKYIASKSIAVFICGFLQSLISMLLFFCTLIMLTKGKWNIGAAELGVYADSILQKRAVDGHEGVLLLNEIATRCVCVAVMSVMGLALYTFIKNKYLVIIAPFFITVASGYIFDFITNQTNNQIFVLLHPNMLMNYMSLVKLNLYGGGIPFTYGVFAVKLVIYIGMFCYGVGRRRRVG